MKNEAIKTFLNVIVLKPDIAEKRLESIYELLDLELDDTPCVTNKITNDVSAISKFVEIPKNELVPRFTNLLENVIGGHSQSKTAKGFIKAITSIISNNLEDIRRVAYNFRSGHDEIILLGSKAELPAVAEQYKKFITVTEASNNDDSVFVSIDIAWFLKMGDEKCQ